MTVGVSLSCCNETAVSVPCFADSQCVLLKRKSCQCMLLQWKSSQRVLEYSQCVLL